MTTRKLLDSQGSMTKKDHTPNKAPIEESAKHLLEYHNPREDVTRSKVSVEGGNDNLSSILAKHDNMDQRITKMGQYTHVIQVGCDNRCKVHLTKDCKLYENGNQKVQVC